LLTRRIDNIEGLGIATDKIVRNMLALDREFILLQIRSFDPSPVPVVGACNRCGNKVDGGTIDVSEIEFIPMPESLRMRDKYNVPYFTINLPEYDVTADFAFATGKINEKYTLQDVQENSVAVRYKVLSALNLSWCGDFSITIEELETWDTAFLEAVEKAVSDETNKYGMQARRRASCSCGGMAELTPQPMDFLAKAMGLTM